MPLKSNVRRHRDNVPPPPTGFPRLVALDEAMAPPQSLVTQCLHSQGGSAVKTVPGSEAASLRVVKKLAISSRGALTLARQFGETLVCVRHRVDAKGEFRYTTVELLVDKVPIRPRNEALVGVRIGPYERSLQTIVRAAGASWDHKTKLWRMPKRLVGILRLTARITDK